MQSCDHDCQRKHDLAGQSESLPGQAFTLLLPVMEFYLLADPHLANVSVQASPLLLTRVREPRQPVPDFVKYPHGPVIDCLRMAHVGKHSMGLGSTPQIAMKIPQRIRSARNLFSIQLWCECLLYVCRKFTEIRIN